MSSFQRRMARLLLGHSGNASATSDLESFVLMLRRCSGPLRAFASRLEARTRARIAFRGLGVGQDVTVVGSLRLDIKGELLIGDRVSFRGFVLPSVIVVHPGGRLEVGNDTWFNYADSLESHSHVKIGKRCMLASYVRVSDSSGGVSGPVVIEDDVWIAHGAIIEPNVTIGRGSVIGAGTVVTKDVPPDTLALGNPARLMSLSMRTRSP